jgi:hypothetical protein
MSDLDVKKLKGTSLLLLLLLLRCGAIVRAIRLPFVCRSFLTNPLSLPLSLFV